MVESPLGRLSVSIRCPRTVGEGRDPPTFYPASTSLALPPSGQNQLEVQSQGVQMQPYWVRLPSLPRAGHRVGPCCLR